MKAAVVLCLSALVLGGQAESVNPVSRVVKLLQGLSKQIEKEGKSEQDLFETFVCWGKSVIAQKKESNTAAQSRIDSLETYISDLSSGKVELTSERQDLEKETEELSADLGTAKAMRKKENMDFESAKTEMTQAINALSSAVKVLNEATKEHKKGALMAFKSELNGGMAAIAAESASLNQAVDLGDRFLTKADALFLKRLLTGDVPKRDHKMLGKKADFKMSYKARSGKIQSVLSKLHDTFKLNLKDAEEKEKTAKASHDKLAKSKGAQLKAAQDALTKGEGENGARGLAKNNAQTEAKALKKQVSDDNKIVKETEASIVEKKKEWMDRSKLRDGEHAAVSKAINILHSDDARDLMKKSFSSQLQRTQGFLFLQEDSSVAVGRAALSELKRIARVTGDRRLSAIAALALDCAADPSAKTKFKPVLAAIDKMLLVLTSDAKKDLETKQSCEKDRQKDTRTVLLASRDIDDKTDAINKLDGEIKDIAEAIRDLMAQKQKAKEELNSAEKLRKDENMQFKITDKEDQEAANTVASAKQALVKYYSKAFKASFVQYQKPEVVAGEAPKPPPATWSTGYGGKKGESTGIIAILEMVHADILKDQATAKAEEEQSQKEFDTFQKDSEKQMKRLQKSADQQKGVSGRKETDKTDTIKARITKKGEYNAVMKKMSDIAPDCEYYAVNFKLRTANRHLEADGLKNAKAILLGGTFKK